tara:strand:- start:49 stop:876 length:828 start_codon:yes stop_codon:yes gene_type:complete
MKFSTKKEDIVLSITKFRNDYLSKVIKLTTIFFISISLYLITQQAFKSFFMTFSVDDFIKVQTLKVNPEKRNIGYIANNPFSSSNKNYLLSEVVIDAPVTTLGLNLYGITFTNDVNKNSAILGFNPNEQKSYKVGDEISSGVLVDYIDRDRVIINREGNQESVRFKRTSIIAINDVKQAKDRPNLKTTIKKENLLSDLFSFVPYYKNGNLKGVEIFPGKNKDLFKENGLQSGDIIIAVNGVSISSPANIRNINTDQITSIEVQRDDKNLSIDLNL